MDGCGALTGDPVGFLNCEDVRGGVLRPHEQLAPR